MISEKMIMLGKKRSVIREIFEYAKKRSNEIGRENIYDFSLGNPNVPAPSCINESIVKCIKNEDPVLLHGYTSAQGDLNVRNIISENINQKFGTVLTADNIYITVGAAASLTISINAIALPDDEFIVFTPFFPEYKIWVEAAGAKTVPVASDQDTFQVDIQKFEKAISVKTKAVIVNSPNNPSGVVLTEDTIQKLCSVMNKKSLEFGHPIYLISDEPYRELVYGNIKVPYLINYYDNTFICYSFSKALSVPGERIGYVVVSNKMENSLDAYAAICGAGRALGYVCAPSLFQQIIAKCINETTDISIYRKNRDLLYEGLTKLGFHCIRPDGAFYLFMKSMEPDANKFCEKAKKYELLLVPGDDFGSPGFVRIAYCVKTEQIINSLPAFEKLAKEYQ
ncbi:MAG: pyridoxal phosphate-dependent aminotransferase [Desulfitobacteriaceae bacterium]|nr:pyridoxal phosphate-dependent aminotransferase [Desulfitobacteriaceae bacterium]MDD4346751.1 pyridoxal phosphate-dependent aminotransferase [Desulfitobacteriaceae bacterium]MDD4401977.1 pyridoxal phosphate-dependent aminotransferase [Desulfitobacteriaceae bacterium]